MNSPQLNSPKTPAETTAAKTVAMEIAQQRLAALRRFDTLRKLHAPKVAARMVGSSRPSLCRWQQRFNQSGLAGLAPKPVTGRPSPWDNLELTAEAIEQLEALAAAHGSPRAAWRQFCSHPACPPALAQYIRRNREAPARLAALARLEPVPATCFKSGKTGRLIVRLPGRGKLRPVACVRLP